MKQLSLYFKGYLKETILGPVFKLLEASFELMVPLVIARLVDQVIPHNDKNHLFLMIFFLVLMTLLGVTVAVTAQYFSSKAAVGYSRNLSLSLYKKIIYLPKESRDQLTTSSLITRLISDTFQIQTGINQFLRLFLRAPIIVFGSVILAYLISPRMTVYFLAMIAILSLVIYVMTLIVNPLYSKIRHLTDRLVAMTREQLEGMRVIRAFNQEEAQEIAFATKNKSYRNWQLRTGMLSSLLPPLTYLVVNVSLILVIWQGHFLILDKALSQGMLLALVNYLLQILIELLKLSMLVTSLNQSHISAKRVAAVLDQEEETIYADLPVETVTSDLSLLVQDLTFTYPNAAKPALSHLDFSLKSGDFMGIIGGTGSGKSTLIQLILGLYQPQVGELQLFHGGSSPENKATWRQLVAYVPQKAELFQGTIRSNLSLGADKPLSDDQLWWALDLAQAREFVQQKSAGLDSQVEAFGRNFSGGQRQRLTIARALLRKANLLILDDATSALDFLTEARLLTGIRKQVSHMSLIMVSQRTNSLQAADQILVLDQGHQVALGAHQGLLETSQIYQEIHYSQHRKEQA